MVPWFMARDFDNFHEGSERRKEKKTVDQLTCDMYWEPILLHSVSIMNGEKGWLENWWCLYNYKIASDT